MFTFVFRCKRNIPTAYRFNAVWYTKQTFIGHEGLGGHLVIFPATAVARPVLVTIRKAR